MELKQAVLLRKLFPLAIAACGITAAALFIAACSSMNGTVTNGMGKVSVMVSDPATCATPNGPFSHVFVTITDVQANINGSAGPNDSGWTDLTPNLKNAPKQVDLLGLANNQCFLATLGDSQQLQAGTYQQIRVILASDSASITSNGCGNGAANCVQLSKDSSFHTLNLSSEAQTGIKIPGSQIASGGLTVAAGKTTDLDIDFLTCQSIVQEGNGQYRLKPVLHAGEVSTVSASINGSVIDASTGKAVAGTAWVSIEQPDAGGVDRVVQSTIANTDGTFVFCPLPAGNYDVVISGVRGSDGALYAPTIITGVAVGDTTGAVKLNAPTLAPGSSFANLTGLVTSANASKAPIAIDVTLTALATVSGKVYTIPQQPLTTPFYGVSQVVTTVTGPVGNPPVACPSGTDCINYSLRVPSTGAYIGAWSAAGVTLAQPAPLPSYAVDGFTTSSCSAADVNSNPPLALAGTGPFTSVAITSNLAFTGCQ
ncbi:DUF4382 domain-containing protein [Occallatibacter savannae]|uniref:DUF4382 domain-containing protein n=1 Tax=Occallatibacter savannae TaxID=1002691 RepID=UPI001EF5A46A|nr:DUF4382 domain-containing protein [Occallatibacter savannae]